MRNTYFIAILKNEKKWAIVLVILHLAVMCFSIVFPKPDWSVIYPEAYTLVFNGAYQGIMILIIAILLHGYMKRMWQNLLSFPKKSVIGAAFLGMAFIYAASLVANILVIILSGAAGIATNQKVVMEMLGSYPVFTVILAMAGAFTEEVIYRGILFQLFYKVNEPFAIIMTAFCFGFIHIVTTIVTGDFQGIADIIFKLIPYFAIGLALALEYKRYKNLWVNIFTHMMWNLLATCMSMLLMKLMPWNF